MKKVPEGERGGDVCLLQSMEKVMEEYLVILIAISLFGVVDIGALFICR